MIDLPGVVCNLPHTIGPDTFTDPAWDAVLPFLGGLNFVDYELIHAGAAARAALAAFLAAHNLPLIVTTGFLKEGARSTGQAAFTAQLGMWRTIAADMPIAAFNGDEPLAAASRMGKPADWAAAEVATITGLLRGSYPDALVLVTEPMPHFDGTQLRDYATALAAAGAAPEALIVDPNWGRADLVWADVAALFQALPVPAGLIYWNAKVKAQDWHAGLLHQAGACKAIEPATRWVCSWTGQPDSNGAFLASVADLHAAA